MHLSLTMADDQRHVLDLEKQDQMADGKQNLSTSIRENLVATAVTFLQNPKVRQSAFAQRKAFLERKGLTADEISMAIQRSGTADDENAAAAAAVDRSSAVVPLRPQEYVVPQVSAWIKVREIASSAVLLTGAAYGLYHFYKEYVAPALFGSKNSKQEEAFDKLEKAIDSLQKNMADVIMNTIELQRQLTNNNEQVLSAVRSSAALRGNLDPGLMNVSDLKDEIKSVKSLLLSRNQFPPTPALAPVIPGWQLQQQQQQQSAFEPTRPPASGTGGTQPVAVMEDNQDTQNDGGKSKDNSRPNDVDDLQLIANKANSEPFDLEKNGKIPAHDSSENQVTKSSSELNGGDLHIKTQFE